MRRPTSYEIKRKIDSKIFELQSSLLDDSGSITQALLEECTLWFRPSHLHDIVIERSEAEHRCGWPGCDSGLSYSQRRSSLILGVSDGEELWRFCCRACMAKMRALLYAIPTTSPYSREAILRLVLPPPQATGVENQGGGGGGEGAGEPGGKSTKKVYKRPRMRTAKRKDSSSPAKLAEGGSGVDGLGERDGGTEERKVNTESEKMSERDSPGVGVVVTDGERESKRDGNSIEDGSDRDAPGKAGDKSVVEILQAELERVSISEAPQALPSGLGSAPSSPCVSEAGAEKKPAPQAATEPGLEPVSKSLSQALARSPSSPPSSLPPSVSTTTTAPSPRATAWESMQFGRSSCAPSAVSLQASLLAEASAVAAETAVAASADTCIDPAAKETKAVTAKSAAVTTTTTSRHGIIRLEQQKDRRDSEADKKASSAKSRRKSVTFADGTKEDPPPSTVRAATLSRESSTPASGVNSRIGKRGGRGRGRERGKGRGGRGGVNGAGRSKGVGSPSDKTVTKSVVLEKVVERKPSMPSPMEVKVAGEGRARVVEGHLPSIKADLSFRVLPKGYCPEVRGIPLFGGVGDAGGVQEEKGGGDLGLGVDGDDIEVIGDSVDGDLMDGDMKKEENGGMSEGMKEPQEGGNNDDDEDDDENDRAIWREAFGSEMPPEVAEGTWIDMDAVHDKELREEYASSIGSFALLWNALSEWVTPETRAVCNAGRAAAKAAAPVVDGSERPSLSLSSLKQLRARQASAVAAAVEAEAHRCLRRGTAGASVDAAAGDDSPGPTVTGALRHSGLSTMVKMHLGRAERLLLKEMMHAVVEEGRITGGPSTKTWTWCEEADLDERRRSGRGRPGGVWVEVTEGKVVDDGGKDDVVPLRGARPGKGGRERREERGAGKSFASTEPCGSAESRRALSAMIETMDAGRASAAANLSIAQWKVVPLVLLTAVGLGGGGGGGGDKGFVEKEEAVRGAEACVRLCEAEAMISAREFEMLVEVLLES